MKTTIESIVSTFPGVRVAALRAAVARVEPGESCRLVVRGGGRHDPWVTYCGRVELLAHANPPTPGD